MNSKLYELIGAIYGDGHLHNTENRITLVGSLEDYFYYSLVLKPLILSIFNIKVYIRRRKENAFCLVFESKSAFNKLQKSLHWRGSKSNLPYPAFSSILTLRYFLRGLFDTDGSLKFSKQTKNINYYPRIQFAFTKTPFSENLGNLLSKFGFSYSRWYSKRDNEYYYQISGSMNLHKWNNIIGFSNPVHKTKYLFWKKFGYSVPRSTLDYRLKTLDLKIEELF